MSVMCVLLVVLSQSATASPEIAYENAIKAARREAIVSLQAKQSEVLARAASSPATPEGRKMRYQAKNAASRIGGQIRNMRSGKTTPRITIDPTSLKPGQIGEFAWPEGVYTGGFVVTAMTNQGAVVHGVYRNVARSYARIHDKQHRAFRMPLIAGGEERSTGDFLLIGYRASEDWIGSRVVLSGIWYVESINRDGVAILRRFTPRTTGGHKESS